MGALRKLILTLVSLLSVVIIVVLVVQNWQTPVSITLVGSTWPAISMGSVLLTAYGLGALGIFAKLWDLNRQVRAQMKQSELRKEKAEVKAETTTDQVRALEAKVQTLEKALEQALSVQSSRKDR